MEPNASTLRMYGQPSELEPITWAEAEATLAAAEFYWVTARSTGHPHPRPVWGFWLDDAVRLSLGSPVLRRSLADDPVVTVHVGDGLEVVVVEGSMDGTDAGAASVAVYDEKYDYAYDADRYGPFTVVRPSTILAWTAAGPAGRDGFRRSGRWTF